jgi:hypothetical protein
VAAPLPIIQAPMAATDVQRPFHHPGWVYEEKVDGWRVLAYKNADGVRLIGEIAVFDRQLIARFEWLRGRPGARARLRRARREGRGLALP